MILLHFKGEPQYCAYNLLPFNKLRPDLEYTPISETKVIYYVNSSSFKDWIKDHTGYSEVRRRINNLTIIF